MIHNSRISRLLPLLNLVGCVLITGLILFQWLKERRMDHQINDLRKQLVASEEQYDAEQKRATALERDVAQLKESIEAAAASKRELEEHINKFTAEQNAANATFATAHQEQVQLWEKAIADRDDRIRQLNESLVATRQRLNEAISQIKKAAASN